MTVLFADVVGSAALGHQHDPEVVWSALKQAFGELQQVLQTHGATVEKLMGDAVMAVFGVPMVHDDDAERAVRAALLIQNQRRTISSGLPISLRIGINSGEVVTGAGEGGAFVTGRVMGGTVNLAARLQQAAEPAAPFPTFTSASTGRNPGPSSVLPRQLCPAHSNRRCLPKRGSSAPPQSESQPTGCRPWTRINNELASTAEHLRT